MKEEVKWRKEEGKKIERGGIRREKGRTGKIGREGGGKGGEVKGRVRGGKKEGKRRETGGKQEGR